MKKFVSAILVLVMMASLISFSSKATIESSATQIISDELLQTIGITKEDLMSGNFVDNGERYPCIIWIEDIDAEIAVKAGIDAAEMTRETYCMGVEYEYPYEVMDMNGQKLVEVNLASDEDDVYVQTYINAERATAAELYREKNNIFVQENCLKYDMDVDYVSSYSPCIFADFDPRPYGTGSFTIKVTQTVSASDSRVTNFGISWR